jgi:hypothetical protein
VKYRRFIQEKFLIDEPKTGKLVPFIFNKVQDKYYDELCRDYDIENKGISVPVREIILKARREGFSSFVLALFAADDILNDNPTETLVVSYKDDATDTFRKRYRRYILSYAARKAGYTVEQIQVSPQILDAIAKNFLSIDANDIELAHNKAHFYCGTASARTGGRGGVLQKVLFSEAAHYPDTDRMAAGEIVDGTLRQVDIASGWAFIESTANGFGNYYEKTWSLAVQGLSRFMSRFYGWREFYSEAEFALIDSEHPDKTMLKQEYPETAEEAFIVSGSPYFNMTLITSYLKETREPLEIGTIELIDKSPFYRANERGDLKVYEFPDQYSSYTIGGDVAEGIEGGDYSVLYVINNKSLRCVAKYRAHISPDNLVHTAIALGLWYNQAYIGIEVNKDGLWVNTELFKWGYPNLYYREAIDDITNRVSPKVGFKTDERTRPYILSELQKMVAKYKDIWTDKDLLLECLTFVRNRVGRPEAMNGKNDDCVFAAAIAYEIRRNAPVEFAKEVEKPRTNEDYVKQRLEELYGRKNTNLIRQDDFI